jgi:hypothetical protein
MGTGDCRLRDVSKRTPTGILSWSIQQWSVDNRALVLPALLLPHCHCYRMITSRTLDHLSQRVLSFSFLFQTSMISLGHHIVRDVFSSSLHIYSSIRDRWRERRNKRASGSTTNITSFSLFLLQQPPLDAKGNILCQYFGSSYDYVEELLRDQLDTNEFKAFWIHAERCHPVKYIEIIDKCRSMIPAGPRASWVRDWTVALISDTSSTTGSDACRFYEEETDIGFPRDVLSIANEISFQTDLISSLP